MAEHRLRPTNYMGSRIVLDLNNLYYRLVGSWQTLIYEPPDAALGMLHCGYFLALDFGPMSSGRKGPSLSSRKALKAPCACASNIACLSGP